MEGPGHVEPNPDDAVRPRGPYEDQTLESMNADGNLPAPPPGARTFGNEDER